MRLQLPTFKDKRDLHRYLVEYKEDLFACKKDATKFTDNQLFDIGGITIKAIKSNKLPQDDLEGGVIHRTIIGNTYLWLDSHEDVHDESVFTKSISETGHKVRHTHDHVQQITAKVGKFSQVYEQKVLWTDLGVNKQGYTTCLLGDSAIEKERNKNIYKDYLNGEIDQHSVEMIYVKMDLAINNKDEKAEYKNWQGMINKLGNPEDAINLGYFFIIKEAKLKAISCVTEASNILTGTIEPSHDTQTIIEPLKSTQRIDYEKLSKIKFFNN